jgi:hypothetical protein
VVLRRKYNGAKSVTEASEEIRSLGRGALPVHRSGTVRSRGAQGSENAGMSSEREVRILSAESLRIPEEGSSAQGKSGPKPRQTCVGDGQRVEIPVPPVHRLSDGVTQVGRSSH